MKQLPKRVQALLCASKQINSYNRAVEELVYNSLDAGATAVAVRINIQDNTLQVIDNGCGVAQVDFNSIGKNYMTSKFTDISTLKSAPNNYGFHGQSLADIIHVSKFIKITSRHVHSEKTFVKIFENGKEKEISECNTRPSKGTTVDVKGFLYNLYIQKKTRDILTELQSIKTFLEHLSLLHSNISLSLRDDTKNEIIFKMHKNRDIYQTLLNLYNIKKENLQELKVEKNEYKVTAFIEKVCNEVSKQFIFLNGKYILTMSKLHKAVNNNLSKYFNLNVVKNLKAKTTSKEENNLIHNKLPFYCIFISCPYLDYNISSSPKQSILEFKDWSQVNKILEKLIKFFTGNMTLKEVNKAETNKNVFHKESSDTREQVKKIMEKILGNHSSKSGILNMQKGINGKQVKRKYKNLFQNNITKTIISKDKNKKKSTVHNKDEMTSKPITPMPIPKQTKLNKHDTKNTGDQNKKLQRLSKSNLTKLDLGTIIGNTFNSKFRKLNNHNNKKKKIIDICNRQKGVCKPKCDIMNKSEIETESVAKRCNKVVKRAKNILDQRNKRKCEMYANDATHYTKTEDLRNVSIQKKNTEVMIHDYVPKPSKMYLTNENHVINIKTVQTNYDLVQTILNSQENDNIKKLIKTPVATMNDQSPYDTTYIADSPFDKELGKNSTIPETTFQSHKYYAHKTFNRGSRYQTNYYNIHYGSKSCIDTNKYRSFHRKTRTFITEQSKDNFMIPKDYLPKNHAFKTKFKATGSKQLQNTIKKLFKQTSQLFSLKNEVIGKTSQSSYTIEFTESNNYNITYNKNNESFLDSPIPLRIDIEETITQSNYNHFSNDVHMSVNNNTYTISKTDHNGYSIMKDDILNNIDTYTIIHSESQSANKDIHFENRHDTNYIFISKSQEHEHNNPMFDPIDVCEPILHSQETLSKEFDVNCNNENNLFDDANNNLQTTHTTDCSHNNVHNKNDKNRELQCKTDNYDKIISNHEIMEEFSHHYSVLNNIAVVTKANSSEQSPKKTSILENKVQNLTVLAQVNTYDKNIKNTDFRLFNLKNRKSFLPKGMSQIYENCHTKYNCEYNLSKDYYEDEMYNNFVDKVRINAEIFEPKIQDVNEVTTKAIDKVNAKLIKENSSLKFDGISLQNAKVLGQIDEKFIAAIMKSRSGKETEEISDFLVLFDQHAVHERIRLETNLTDYFHENQWKSIKIEEVVLKMSEDHVLYLHNFKDKFAQLGLQCNVLSNDEVSVTSIPEAICGKNPREMDKVIKAVKNLISEEVNIINMQGGCITLYPKSIMDLVCSEACRYAIKFGDKLSKDACVELLKILSDCKTPFQCAHGRPVMAVIVDSKPIKADYKININKIAELKKRMRKRHM